ncbi:MAG TPA: hypothetical protein VKY27_01675 [Bacteriovoracaceae bacterium]|nr:hypothetical protein [Bacteriovoracaceae bacterium]
MNFKIISLLSLITLIGCGETSKDKKKSSSVLQEITLDSSFIFKDLPLTGAVKENETLWSGDHWPMNKSSINYRWQTNEKNFQEYHLLNLEELKLMSEDEIAHLSPTEKLDILIGDYKYSFFKEVAKKVNIVALSWEGIGDGWAAATVFHQEPKPVTLTNPDNIVVSFGSSDIKALLSYYYSSVHKAAREQMGLRCNSPQEKASEDKNCNNDLTAAQFHQALGKVVGQSKRPLIMDIDRYEQVWNHPILSYEASIISEGDPAEKAPKEAKKTIGIKNKVTYLDRSYNHAWNPVKGTWNQVSTNRVYSYQLHLDQKGKVIGSNWVSHDRPDFLWLPQKAEKFSGKLSVLEKLLK